MGQKNVQIESLNSGVYLLDTGFQRPQMAACYLLEDDGEVAIVETGTKDTVPMLLNALEQLGLAREQVKYVIVTHVHLDHAGGAGGLMQALGDAKLVVHEKGARHMVDPSKLQAGATAVYGKAEFDKTYGDLLPVEESRILIPKDEEALTLGNRTLTFLDTPGHARHHFCILDSKSHGFFTGDTFGLAYRELTHENHPFIFPTTTPVQFDPEAMKASINRMMSYEPNCMYLTHYGKVEQPEVLAEQLVKMVDELVALALALKEESNRLQKLNDEVLSWLKAKLSDRELSLTDQEIENVIRSDAFLNAQGLNVWLSQL